jgi:hypothetical protein
MLGSNIKNRFSWRVHNGIRPSILAMVYVYLLRRFHPECLGGFVFHVVETETEKVLKHFNCIKLSTLFCLKTKAVNTRSRAPNIAKLIPFDV